jgi:mono/diheme cytochrome c family protein
LSNKQKTEMNKTILLIGLLGLISARPSLGQDVAQLFSQKCGICHTIGGGKLVGPDLAGVHDRHPQEWLLSFIKSSQTMIKSGDAKAVALFEQYNNTVMPDPMISDQEILDILKHIKESQGAASAPYESILAGAGEEDIEMGRKLFDGRLKLAGGGPSCIACHNGLSNTFFNENSYAKDLGGSFATLGEQGVRAILENPPFPVMAEAFRGKALKPEETKALLAYLKAADPEQSVRAAGAPGSGFFLYGLMGGASLIILFSGLWYSRKERSVNHSIYKRQIKSQN